jgi:hypothetical protein
MTTKSKVQFILRSADIYPNITYVNNLPPEPTIDYTDSTTLNFINRWQTKMIFKNINLRTILGKSFKYGKTYNLKINAITFCINSNLGNFTLVENDRTFNIFLKGLPFIQTFSTKSGTINEGLIATVRIPSGAQSYTFSFSNPNILSFTLTEGIGVERTDITIEYRDLLTGLNEPSTNLTTALPHAQFVFTIEEAD